MERRHDGDEFRVWAKRIDGEVCRGRCPGGSKVSGKIPMRAMQHDWREGRLGDSGGWDALFGLGGDDTEDEIGAGTDSGVATFFIEGEKVDGEFFGGALFAFDDALDDLGESFFGGGTIAHEFDGEEATAIAEDVFAGAGCAGGSDLVIDVESATDDRAIADASWHLVHETAGGATAGEIAIGGQGEHGNGIVSLEGWLRVGFFGLLAFPLFPIAFGFFAGGDGGFAAMLFGEFASISADEEGVRGFLHDEASDGDGVFEAFEARDGAGTLSLALTVHDASVELENAIGIGVTADADEAVGEIGFGDADTGFDGIHSGLAGLEDGAMGFTACFEAEGPGRDDDGVGGGVVVGSEYLSGGHEETGAEGGGGLNEEVASVESHDGGGLSWGVEGEWIDEESRKNGK